MSADIVGTGRGAERDLTHPGARDDLRLGARGEGARPGPERAAPRPTPPEPAAPDELDHDALVPPLGPPSGALADLATVRAAPFIRERLDAIAVGS